MVTEHAPSPVEYLMLTWGEREGLDEFLARLNVAGSEGWDAVGIAPRAVSVPMPGMGADAVPEIVIILKRAV